LNIIPLTDPLDPRLAPYWALPQKKSGGAEASGLFIAEGRMVVERLLRSPYQPAGLLVAESKRSWAEHGLAQSGSSGGQQSGWPIYTLPDAVLHQAVGFQFHSGIMGCGRRQVPAVLQERMDDWFRPRPAIPHRLKSGESGAGRETLLVLPAVNSAENLGSIIRSAHGLGAAGMILGQQSADPLARRVIRVSMGHTLAFPYLRSPDWRTDLQRLREAGFCLIGIEHHSRMVPLRRARPAPRQALVFGNEFSGMDNAVLDLMDQVVGIPMANQVDSLNVAVSAAIALYHFLGDEVG
jgi:tRNA G18 (ribose-2'-O)-methylase SpoU